MRAPNPWGLIDLEEALPPGLTPDAAVARIGQQQLGLVTTQQLSHLGIGGAGIGLRVRRGQLHRMHRGVYAVGFAPGNVEAAIAAAVLSCGPRSAASHGAAAVVWHLLDLDLGLIDISVTAGQRRARPGIRTHRLSGCHPRDIRRRSLIPVTSPARTILDVAHLLGPSLAEEALNEARTRRLVRRGDSVELRRRTIGGRGWGTLTPILRVDANDDFSRHAAEKALNALIRRAELEKPRRNLRIHGLELDFYWPDLKLNIEVDGYEWHSARNDLNRDRERDSRLATLGIQVVRFTRDQIRFRPEVVIARLSAAVALRRAQLG